VAVVATKVVDRGTRVRDLTLWRGCARARALLILT
jgi:hypothetical protein